jgi:hypothetical protein
MMKDIYLQTSSGDSLLVEIGELNNFVTFRVAGSEKRIDIELDSVVELAEYIFFLANDIEHKRGRW